MKKIALKIGLACIVGIAHADKYQVSDYVQSGLVAMWDCSTGLDSTGWKDTSGTYTFAWDGSTKANITYGANGVVFPGELTAYATLSDSDTTSTFYAGRAGTVEVVFKRNSTGTAMLFQAPATAGQQAALWGATGLHVSSGSTSRYYAGSAEINSTDFCSVSALYSGVAVPAGPAYVNGIRRHYTTSTTFGNTGSTTRLGGRNSGATGSAFNGTVYCIRIYSRNLTAAEIGRNNFIDNCRFVNDTDKPVLTAETATGYGTSCVLTEGGKDYQIATFTNTSAAGFTWEVPAGVYSIDLLVGGGGGSGGAPSSTYPTYTAGGGGAGGLVYKTAYAVTPGETNTVKVGAGGAAVTGGASGLYGGDSSFSNHTASAAIVALGGGRGRYGGGTAAGGNGGSGGGGTGTGTGGVGLQPLQSCGGYGNNGGTPTSTSVGASGGGAGGAGQVASAAGTMAFGGAGMELAITGENLLYARGGASGVNLNVVSAGGPGRDGFGDGGGAGSGSQPTSGKGGDGVVIIRYALPVTVDSGIVVASSSQDLGTPNPDYGTHADLSEVGTNYAFSCTEEVVVTADIERWHCVGYKLFKIEEDFSLVLEGQGDSNTVSVVYAYPVKLEWQWQREFKLTVAAGANGSVTVGETGWYAEGAAVALTATGDTGYVFDHWEGDVADAYEASTSVTPDAAKTVTAVFVDESLATHYWKSQATEATTVDFWDQASWNSLPANDGTSIVKVTLPKNPVTVTIVVTNALNLGSLDLGLGDGAGKLVVEFRNGLDTNKVAGTVNVRSGLTLTHKVQNNNNTEAYKLNIEVGGDMTLDTGASIGLVAKGFPRGYGPGKPTSDYLAAAHGGQGGSYPGYGINSLTYGSIRQPDRAGSSGGGWESDHIGGGVVHLMVDGDLTIKGSVVAEGATAFAYCAASGGSVWIECARLLGNGTISVRGGKSTGYTYAQGGGGRLAIYESAGDRLASFTGTLQSGAQNVGGGCGSIYVQGKDDDEGLGELIVDNAGVNPYSNPDYYHCYISSAVTDAQQPFGKVTARNRGRLQVASGRTLKVRDAISVDSVSWLGTVASGGTVEFVSPAYGAMTVSGALNVYGLVCTNSPGATINFANGSVITNFAGGTVKLCGTKAGKLNLAPATAEATWYLDLAEGQNADSNLTYLTVANSTARAATPTATKSEDRKNNVNWEIEPEPGLAIMVY